MIRRIFILLTILILNLKNLNAQKNDSTLFLPAGSEIKDIGLILGLHQFTYTFIEFGISETKSKGGCFWGSYFNGTSLSAEYNPFQNKTGLMFSVWTCAFTFITLGINANSYTDFDKYNLGVKPFIGIGPGEISLTYGYNFQIIDHKIPDLNKHCFSLRYHLPVRGRK